MKSDTINTRVLIIDDEEIVRDDMEEILVPKAIPQNVDIVSASSILFEGDENEKIVKPINNNIPVFSVDKAINGREGLEKIKQSINENKPYAVIFLDMRMPGWDGLETALQIRQVDIKAEIIIVTAYSDTSIEEIVAKAGQNVGYHCKPYVSEEILQLATKAVSDYNKLRNLEKLISVISNINLSETHLDTLLQHILDQLATYIGSETAVLGILHNTHEYQKLFSNGTIEKEIDAYKLAEIFSTSHFNTEEVEQIDNIVFVKVEGYSIFAVLGKERQLKTEKLYLLKLFVQSAAKAIKNTQLNEELLQKEKLSAVGKALGMLMHDLRGPIKNIPVLTSFIREEGCSSEFLDSVDKCGEQASEIVDDFLDFIRETPILLRPLPVDQLISEGIDLADSRTDLKVISLNKKIEPNLFVQGDSSKLKRVIMNIVVNAGEALKDNKVLSPAIDITATKTDDMVVINIKDNGPGIPDKIIRNLFDAFVTSDKSNGTGLGLAIVKQYILAHKGTISVKNNNGAQFTILLPVYE